MNSAILRAELSERATKDRRLAAVISSAGSPSFEEIGNSLVRAGYADDALLGRVREAQRDLGAEREQAG